MKTQKFKNGITIKIYQGIDGDYHVERYNEEFNHDHEIFNNEDDAENFYNKLIKIENK